MKRIVLFAFSLLFSILMYAQSPGFQWAKKAGGTSVDKGRDIKVDASGNIYIAGSFQETADFDPDSSNTFNLTSAGKEDIFILKLDATGKFLWAKRIGGTSDDYVNSMALDASGNVYITGGFNGTVDFDPGSGTVNKTAVLADIYILKLDGSGNFVWAKTFSGTSLEQAYSIAIGPAGDVFTTGVFYETLDFDPGAAKFELTANYYDVFMLKLDASGNFLWAKKMGGTGYELGSLIKLDAPGNIYTAGTFSGTADFDPGTGTFELTSAAGQDIFVSKLDASGNFVWARKIEGPLTMEVGSIAVDLSGNVYTTGYYNGTADFDPGTATFNMSSNGSFDFFISKLDAAGNFVWAKNVGGNSQDEAFSITTDLSGNIYTTGHFFNTVDFDPDPIATSNLTSAGSDDVFILKLNSEGKFLWAKNVGGTSVDQGYDITLDNSSMEDIYLTGHFMQKADFDPSAAIFNLTSVAKEDVFILKLSAKSGEVKGIGLNPIKIYPNPTISVLNLDLEFDNYGWSNKMKIQVFNINGQVVLDELVTSIHSSFVIEHFPAGMYFVKVLSDKLILGTQRIIKQ
jgi:hypothetical protein